MAVIYRVNMSDLSVRVEEPSEEYQSLGGRALTSAIVAGEVPPTCHPLSSENKLVLAPGILSGTGSPCTGRLSAGGKSPLTGTIKESNAGGQGATALATAGVKALVLEGKPAALLEEGKPPLRPFYRLIVNHEGIRIEPAVELAGLGNYATVARLFEEFGDKVCCISIGPAGEMLCAAASIAVTDPEGRPTRHCGRGGLGALMGSKGVKAIVVDPTGGQRPKPADLDVFRAGVKKFNDALQRHPVSGQGLPKYGTNVLTNVMNAAGGLPTRNFRRGQFSGAEAISGERQHDVIVARGGAIGHACHRGCTVKCSRLFVDEQGNYVTKGPEYETVWAHGSHCEIDDLDAIARMDYLEDDLGIDTIETGVTIGVAMDAGIIPFGDADAAIGLLEEVARGTPLGRLVASGADALGKVYGVSRVPTVKGQSLPAYDPRAVKGIGVTYATSPMGADHTAGYAVASNILGLGQTVDPLSPEGQVALSRTMQIATASLDAAGLCLFVAFSMLDDPAAVEGVCEMLSGFYGREVTPDDYLRIGSQTLGHERRFNRAAGFSEADDRLPDFFRNEKLPPHDATFDVPDRELDTLFDFVDRPAGAAVENA
jgi:aldehyde:ferredoxin oxidoreductase